MYLSLLSLIILSTISVYLSYSRAAMISLTGSLSMFFIFRSNFFSSDSLKIFLRKFILVTAFLSLTYGLFIFNISAKLTLSNLATQVFILGLYIFILIDLAKVEQNGKNTNLLVKNKSSLLAIIFFIIYTILNLSTSYLPSEFISFTSTTRILFVLFTTAIIYKFKLWSDILLIICSVLIFVQIHFIGISLALSSR